MNELFMMHTTWIDAVNSGDLARLLTSMADGVFLNPGQAPVGRPFHGAYVAVLVAAAFYA
jgi:hypothetical protein